MAYLDHEIGKLQESLTSLKRFDNSMWVITSDHGEALGEHGLAGHGQELYEHQLRIPLLIRYPHQSMPLQVGEPVSQVDLVPTVLDSIGYPFPEGADGQSIRAGFDRSIVISLRRRAGNEKVQNLRIDRLVAELEPMRRKAVRWAADTSTA